MAYVVVVNEDGHYSLWADDRRPLPTGWREAGVRGTEAECLDYIQTAWPDVLPRQPCGEEQPRLGREPTAYEVVADHAAHRSDAAALRWKGSDVTYGELDDIAGRLAGRLAAAGVRRGDVVPVRLPRSPGLVTALLAVLRLGAAYIAVPADWPPDRLSRLVHIGRSPLAVDHRADPTRWPCSVVALSTGMPSVKGYNPAEAARSSGEDPACVFFTSGSTGEPKGAVCPHRALTGLLFKPEFAEYGSDTVTLQAAALPWDAFALELWGALLNGGYCVLPPEGPLGPVELREAVCGDGVNTLWLTSSLFNTLVDVDPSCMDGVRQVLIGGERLSVPHVRRFRQAHPGIHLINGYGPVEATIFTTTHPIRDSDVAPGRTDVPIGRPVRGTWIDVLDTNGRPVSEGQVGELYVSGQGLTLGYLSNPRETARRFVPIAGQKRTRAYRTGDLVRKEPDGVLRYVGRTDRQVKLRGVRVEPGDVEAAMRDCAGIADAAVVPCLDANGTVVALHGWYTGKTDPSRLRDELAKRLPAAFVPTTFAYLKTLPKGSSGKTDTRALQQMTAALEAPTAGAADTWHGQPPAAGFEPLVRRLMTEVLGQPLRGEDIDFLYAGGTSLTAITLAVRLSKETGRRISATDVLAARTATAIAQEVQRAAPLAIPTTDGTAVSAAQRGLWMAERIYRSSGDRAHLVHRLFQLDGEVDVDALALALEDVAQVHPTLRHVLSGEGTVPSLSPLDAKQAVVLTSAPPVRLTKQLLERPDTWQVGLVGPTVRLTIAPCGPTRERSVLVVVAHHAFIDGWSLRVLFQDLSLAYGSRRLGRPPRLVTEGCSYADWAAAEGTSDRTAAVAFWRAELRDVPNIAWPSSGTAGGEEFAVRDVELPSTLWRYARNQRVTVTSVLVTALVEALGTVTVADDLCVAVPVAGRDDPNTERTIGLFVNPLPVRIRFADIASEARLRATQDALLGAMRNAMPFDEIVAVVRPQRSERPTLCQVSVLRHLHPDPRLELPGVTVSQSPAPPSGAMYEMMFEVWPRKDGGWTGSLQTRRRAVADNVADAVHDAVTATLSSAGGADR